MALTHWTEAPGRAQHSTANRRQVVATWHSVDGAERWADVELGPWLVCGSFCYSYLYADRILLLFPTSRSPPAFAAPFPSFRSFLLACLMLLLLYHLPLVLLFIAAAQSAAETWFTLLLIQPAPNTLARTGQPFPVLQVNSDRMSVLWSRRSQEGREGSKGVRRKELSWTACAQVISQSL